MQESLSQLRHGLPPRGLLGLNIDLRDAPLPPPGRADAFGVLDITEYVGESSGGIRTYLEAKAAWIGAHPETRQTIVVRWREDALLEGPGSRTYQLQGPPIPLNAPYRFLLSSATTGRIIAHERPDLIEIGSHLLVPWVVRRANRGPGVPLVWFYHGHLPRLIAPDHRRGVAQRALEAV
ncbi:MAG: glycosyltransferase, partial [Gemmatimonadetes bacterium]|nr:glycosyltransferase [Gemmatimonadota bacterium]